MQQVHISETTAWRWMKLEAFQAAYLSARREVVRQAVAQLQQATGEAVEALRQIMQDTDAPASARVAAARTVLETAIKAVEVEDLESRIVALEAQTHGLPV